MEANGALQEEPCTSNQSLLFDLKTPASVEVRAVVEDTSLDSPGSAISVNISSALIEDRLGLEWSHIPFRSQLPSSSQFHSIWKENQMMMKDGMSGSATVQLAPSLTTKDETLLYSDNDDEPAFPLKDQLDLKVARIFENEPEMEGEVIQGEGNEISMFRPDVQLTLKNECISPIFRGK